jgi:hypothetical protein
MQFGVSLAAAAVLAAFAAPLRADEPGAPTAPVLSEADRAKWGDHMGDLPFVVGSEAGRKAAAAAGKTPLYFFTATW